MKNPILKMQRNCSIFYYCVYNLLFVWLSFFAYKNPIFLKLLVLIAFRVDFYKTQIFEIKSVFIEIRLKVSLTLTSLFTTNLAILKFLKLSSVNLIA